MSADRWKGETRSEFPLQGDSTLEASRISVIKDKNLWDGRLAVLPGNRKIVFR